MLVRVDYAVDGDTLYAYPQDTERFGTTPSRVKVRLIGLDTPEIEHDDPAECFGDEAWDFTRDALTGRLAWLTFDAECEDDYDRTLAYLHREADSAGFFNRALLRQGYATVLTVRPNNSFVSSFEQDEAAARADGIGLWSACPR